MYEGQDRLYFTGGIATSCSAGILRAPASRLPLVNWKHGAILVLHVWRMQAYRHDGHVLCKHTSNDRRYNKTQ